MIDRPNWSGPAGPLQRFVRHRAPPHSGAPTTIRMPRSHAPQIPVDPDDTPLSLPSALPVRRCRTVSGQKKFCLTRPSRAGLAARPAARLTDSRALAKQNSETGCTNGFWRSRGKTFFASGGRQSPVASTDHPFHTHGGLTPPRSGKHAICQVPENFVAPIGVGCSNDSWRLSEWSESQ